jgi:hypothetical protein
MPVTINEEQGLYVIPCGKGFSCLGFDVCLERATKLSGWLLSKGVQHVEPDHTKRGTMAAYDHYQTLLSIASEKCLKDGIRCDAELTPQLIGLERKRVEVVDCYGEKRRFQVGKSTGWMPCHLEIHNRRSSGGPAAMGTPYKSVRVV